MKKKIIFYILLVIIIIILFGFLYFIGLSNYLNLKLIKQVDWLEFDKSIAVLYLVIVTIFLIVVTAIMTRIILSLKQEKLELTSIDVDDISIRGESNENSSDSFKKLMNSLNSNIDAIQKYTETINRDINIIDSIKDENTVQEKIDSLHQNFSQMITDFTQSNTIAELFEKILIWGIKFSYSKRGSIMIVDKNKELYIYKTIGWNKEEKQKISEIRIPLGSEIAGKVAAENKRIFVTNIENYENHNFKFKDKYTTKSFISLPICGIRKVVAVLNLTENKKDMYTLNDLEILNVIMDISSKLFELIQIKKQLLK